MLHTRRNGGERRADQVESLNPNAVRIDCYEHKKTPVLFLSRVLCNRRKAGATALYQPRVISQRLHVNYECCLLHCGAYISFPRLSKGEKKLLCQSRQFDVCTVPIPQIQDGQVLIKGELFMLSARVSNMVYLCSVLLRYVSTHPVP